MQQFLIYEVKVAVIMAVFFLFFRAFLSKESLHRLNRVVLVGTVIASFLLPFCVITVHKSVPAPVGVPEVVSVESSVPASGIDWWMIAAVIYLAGAVTVLVRVVIDVVRLRHLIASGEHHEDVSGNTIVVLDRDISPFSWIHYIFLSREDYKICSNHILEHERAHIRLGHAKELLCVELLSAMQWFNPAMWYLKSDLDAIYEYEADDAVLRNGADIRDYQYSLVRKAFQASGYSITNSFNQSILKNRITMMSRAKGSALRWTRCLYVLPLLCATLVLNARTIIDIVPSKADSNKSFHYLQTDVHPSFNGGDTNTFAEWVSDNLVKPSDGSLEEVQGRVSVHFTIDSEGHVSDVFVNSSTDKVLETEAVRVISSSPDWVPGKVDGEDVAVDINFPVVFR